jgi:thioredoxin-related protein
VSPAERRGYPAQFSTQAREANVFRIAALLLVLFLNVICYAGSNPGDTTAVPGRVAFDPQRDADKDIRDAMGEATRSGRRIMLDVGGEWCPWCKRLDAFFATNADAADLLHKNYVVVKVNYSKENKNEAVLSRYPKIPGYPHLFILDAKGALVHSQDTGLLEEGKGYSKEKILAFLKEWAPGKSQGKVTEQPSGH